MGDYPILTDNIRVLENAVVVPAAHAGASFGVFDQNGNFVEESREYRYPFDPVPEPEYPSIDLSHGERSGTYLYAASMHQHFGHFITESVARLWPLKDTKIEIQGVVFVSRRPKSIWRMRRANRSLIDFFCMGQNDIPVTHPTRFEKLIVADAGTGIGDRMRGTEAFRDYLKALAARTPSLSTCKKKVYLSRRQLPPRKGRILSEDLLWSALDASGYTEVHLQNLPFQEQLDVIRNATHIIGTDGSPFHLVAYFAAADAKVSLIARRRSNDVSGLIEQFQMFQQRDIHFIDAIQSLWTDAKPKSVLNDHSVLAEVDLEYILKELADEGFISNEAAFKLPDPPTTEDQVKRFRENAMRRI